MHLPDNTLLSGGKYRILRFISSGGFGCTYEAEHVLLEKRVAIKEFFVKDFCNRDETTSHITVGTQSKKGLVEKLRRKFIDEARSLSQLHHPGIVSVSDVFEENGTAYFVMDFIEGRSLGDIVNQEGPLPEERAVRYIRQIADALQYVHDNNRLHLDIKPGNIMIDENDNPVLIDFGASKQYDELDGENTSTLMGKTPGYAPPEQMSNSVVKFLPATDIYALGATLYKLLTGITPPDASLRISGEEMEPLPAPVGESTRNAITAAMEINKNKRTQALAEFLALLDEPEVVVVPEDETKLDPAPEPTTTPRPKSRSRGWLIGGIAALLAAAVVLVLAGLLRRPGTGTNPGSLVQAEDAALPDIEMVYVEGGTFQMGASAGDSEASEDEMPAHSVTLSSYYIGKYEVTQALWKAVMGGNPSRFKGDNLPVENVSWDDVQEFLRKLNEMTGKQYRLPTEAEREYAARGGSRSRGYKYSGSNDLASVAWYSDNSGGQTHPVGTKTPNELGIHDMTGNVAEMCSDWYGSYHAGVQTNPKGPSSGSSRVIRGGSWSSYAVLCRVPYRSFGTPDYRFNNLGFRLAMDLDN